MTTDPATIIERTAPDLEGAAVFTDEQVERVVVRAIHAKTVAEVARALESLEPDALGPAGRALARSAASACAGIAAHNRGEETRMAALLEDAGVAVTHGEIDPASQFHAFLLRVNPDAMAAALAVARDDGFLGCEPWLRRGGLRPLLRTRRDVTVIRTDEVTTRMTLRWRDRRRRGRLARLFEPAETDFAIAPWPAFAWPLYHLNKPLRLLGARIGIARRGQLAPFLGTPTELIPALLDAADVTADDHLMDLGCGDGRIVVEAARLRGCRAVGIEQDADLVERARARAGAAALAEKVRIQHGDMTTVDLSEVTVAFLFLPHETIARVLPSMRARFQPGTRIVIHEQAPIDPELKPDRSTPLIGRFALTVAHVWGLQ